MNRKIWCHVLLRRGRIISDRPFDRPLFHFFSRNDLRRYNLDGIACCCTSQRKKSSLAVNFFFVLLFHRNHVFPPPKKTFMCRLLSSSIRGCNSCCLCLCRILNFHFLRGVTNFIKVYFNEMLTFTIYLQ